MPFNLKQIIMKSKKCQMRKVSLASLIVII